MLVDKGIISFLEGSIIWSVFNCIMLTILYFKARKEIKNKKL